MRGSDLCRLKIAPAKAMSRRSWGGFTLVELIVVLILAGILAAIGASRFFDRGAFDVSGFSNQAKAALRFAQKEAIAQNRSVTVRLDSAGISLCFSTSSPCPAAQQVTAPFSASTDTTYCTSSTWYCLRRPNAVTYSTSLGSPGSLTFDAVGRPWSGGAALASAASVTVSDGASNTSSITIEPETGYVH